MLWEKVLIPIDFSMTTDLLLGWAERIAKMGLKEVILLHVMLKGDIENQLIHTEKAQENINRYALQLKNQGIQVKAKIEIGVPSIEIVRAAEEEQVSMLIMGAIGKGVFKQIIAGSTAFDVVRTSKIPVLIVKNPANNKDKGRWAAGKLHRVLCPIDFSSCSSLIVQRLKECQFYIEELILTSIIEKGETQAEVNSIKGDSLRQLVNLGEDFYELGSRIEILVEEGIASKNIIRIAHEKTVDIIVMGMTGESYIKTLLLGSTAEAVLRTSKEPVLFIPCPK